MKLLPPLACAALTALLLAVGAAAGTSLEFTVKTRQGPTTLHAHPPIGGVGDTTDSTLVLRNAGIPLFGMGKHANIGTMEFTYTIRKQCAAFGGSCQSTADFHTLSDLPGGTVTAEGKSISISRQTITIPVVGGTGRYAGARGTVTISPASTKLSTYRLKLP
jgi:hypothetical protein